METNVNISLLRKAVEWAEAEAAKPPELCEWEQNYYEYDPRTMEQPVTRPATGETIEKAAECGTCYCIAGFVARQAGMEAGPSAARELLGLNVRDGARLFDYNNTIEDVRRIAESLAGERL